MLIDGLITSKTRVKLLLKFFLNPEMVSYLRELAGEFGESTNSIRVELNSMTEAKLLKREKNKNTVAYKANKTHPLFKEIRSIILKTIGIDKLITSIIDNIGKPDLIILTGDYARGIDSGIIDIVIVGSVDQTNLLKYIAQVEKIIERKVRYLVLYLEEYKKLEAKLTNDGMLILWDQND